MSRLSSGNLNNFRAAKRRLADMGCCVATSVRYDARSLCEVVGVTVTMDSTTGDQIGDKSFDHYDINVAYNQATYWLTEVAEELGHWK